MLKLVKVLILVSFIINTNKAWAEPLKGGVSETELQPQATQAVLVSQVAQTQFKATVKEDNPITGEVRKFNGAEMVWIGHAWVPLHREKAQAQHGEQCVGVLGCHVNDRGVIDQIYPGSRLYEVGIQEGDMIINFGGSNWDVNKFRATIGHFGQPGEYYSVTIYRAGFVKLIYIPLIDVRSVINYDNSEGRYHSALSNMRYW